MTAKKTIKKNIKKSTKKSPTAATPARPADQRVLAEVAGWVAAMRYQLGRLYESTEAIDTAIADDPDGELAAAFGFDRDQIRRLASDLERAELTAGALRVPTTGSLPDPVAASRR